MPKAYEDQENEFEDLYLKERKKSSMLTIAVVVLSIVTVWTLAWSLGSSSDTAQTPAAGQFGEGGGPGGGGQGMMQDISSFFADDGSVDTDQIEEMTSRFPSGADSDMSSRIVDMMQQQADTAVEDGDITQEQADALMEAFTDALEASNE